jgi:hypothetical protein
VLTVALALLVGALGLSRAAAAETPGLLRLAHLSPDTPAVDIAVAPLPAGTGAAPLTDPGPDLATGLSYGTLTGFRRLAPGSYAVSLRAAGSPRTTPPALSVRVEVPPGDARTVAVSGRFADLALRVLPEDLSSPGAGSARVRVLAGAAAAGPLDATLERPGAPPTDLASGLRYPGAGTPVEVPAGSATVDLGSARSLPVHLAGGSVVSLIVLDAPGGGLMLRTVVDAAGPAIVPRGPVDAGGGGTAGPSAVLLGAGAAFCAALAGCALRGRRRLVALAAAALVLAGVQPAAADGPVAAAATPPPPITAGPIRASGTPALAGVPPRRVQVASAGVDTALSPIRLDSRGILTPPADTATAGWFASGPAPGDVGPAVLAGHVDSTAGPGAFFRLGSMAVGDPVVVTRADGTALRFTVTRVARFPKTAFPTAEVYGPTTDAELRLITCGGRFDRARHSYVDDVVVFARLTGPATR